MDVRRCVFHQRTSANAAEDELLPLSALEHTDPDAFAAAIAKYDDTPERTRLRDTRIPGLDARWTEVVFLSPVHPHAIWRAWRDIAGIELPAQDFWAIPVGEIGRAVVLDRHLSRAGDPINQREVQEFDAQGHRAMERTTPGNEAWIEKLARERKRGAWFHGTPHVLTPEPVPLRSAQVIDWSRA